MSAKVTEADILDALRHAMGEAPEDVEGWSVNELRKLTGRGERKVCEGLRKLIEEGKMETVYVRRPNMTGRIGSVPIYRLK